MTIKIYLIVTKKVESVKITNFKFNFEDKKNEIKLASGEITIKELS